LIDGRERIRLAGHAHTLGIDLNVRHLDRESGRQSSRDGDQGVEREPGAAHIARSSRQLAD